MIKGCFVALASKYDMYYISKCTSMPCISLRNQDNLLLFNMKHVKINIEIPNFEHN